MSFLKKSVGKNWLKILFFLPSIPIVWLIMSLDRFTGIDDFLRLLVSVAIVLLYLFLIFSGSYFSINKRKIGKGFVVLLTIGFLFGTTYGAVMAHRVVNILDTITERPVERGYSLVVMANFDAGLLNGYGRVGVLSNIEESMHEARTSFLEEQGHIQNPIAMDFDMPVEMINALYSGEIDAMIISSNFVNMFIEIDGFESIEYDTMVLATFDVLIEQVDQVEIDPGEPFSILFLGLNQNNDDLASGQINTFMLLTINLQEASFTAVSIPRDSYVQLPCSNYRHDKLSHSNFGGTACAVGAVERIFDMEIDYYVRLNFTGFMEIIDILGGVEVDVPFAFSEQNSRRQFGENAIYVEAGLQRLNSEQALALVRHRNLRGTSTMVGDDFARVSNQQLVFQAMLHEMFNGVNGINDILPLLEVIGVHVETNLSAHNITTIGMYMIELLQGQSSSDFRSTMNFANMVLLGEGADVLYPFEMNVVNLYQNMIDDARRIMMINLGLEEPEFSFTFSFNAFLREGHAWSTPDFWQGFHYGGNLNQGTTVPDIPWEYPPAYEPLPPLDSDPGPYIPAPTAPPFIPTNPPPISDEPPADPVGGDGDNGEQD
ncbi:MAG: LCP family protein [Turicibacter sp.]|nr:LCP family protein [Turicibacter sp.]